MSLSTKRTPKSQLYQAHAIDEFVMDKKSGSIQKLRYVQYDSSKESQYLSAIRQLISKDLSEPYSIYVYRYFLYQWGHLCFMVRDRISMENLDVFLMVTYRRWMRMKSWWE